MPEMPEIVLRNDITANDAVKVVALCDRILGDMGSVYRRAFNHTGMPPELMQLRRYLRELQDSVQEQVPDAFYK